MAINFLKIRNGVSLTPQSQPTGANGDIYYDSGANVFEFFQNGAWVTYGASGTVTALGSAGVSTKSGAYAIVTADNGRIFLADTTSAAFSFTLPVAVAGFIFTIKDAKGQFGTNNCTLAQNTSESIEGLASSFAMAATWGSWTFVSDGTNWFVAAH